MVNKGSFSHNPRDDGVVVGDADGDSVGGVVVGDADGDNVVGQKSFLQKDGQLSATVVPVPVLILHFFFRSFFFLFFNSFWQSLPSMVNNGSSSHNPRVDGVVVGDADGDNVVGGGDDESHPHVSSTIDER